MNEKDSIGNIDAVTDDHDNVLSRSDDEHYQVEGEIYITFKNCIQNVETSFNTPSPVQSRQRKFKKQHPLIETTRECINYSYGIYYFSNNSNNNVKKKCEFDVIDQFFYQCVERSNSSHLTYNLLQKLKFFKLYLN